VQTADECPLVSRGSAKHPRRENLAVLHVFKNWHALFYVGLELLAVPERVVFTINRMVEWNPAEAYVPITECLMTIYINVSIVDKAAKCAESRFSYLLRSVTSFVAVSSQNLP
jgi:hypothetical protein